MDINKGLAWIELHWGRDKTCPMCGGWDWKMSDQIGVLAGQMDLDRNVDLTKGMPIVPVTCEVCGFVALLDAVKAGLIQGGDPPLWTEPN